MVEDGIYFMYHGTKVKNVPSILREGFRVSKDGMLGRGVYVSLDVNKAQKYGEVVLKLLVFVGKVRLVTSQDQPDRKTWQHNYDSAHVPEGCGMVRSGMTETCIKSPMYVSSSMQVVFFKKRTNNFSQIKVVGVSWGFDLLGSPVRALTMNLAGVFPALALRGEVEELKAQNGVC